MFGVTAGIGSNTGSAVTVFISAGVDAGSTSAGGAGRTAIVHCGATAARTGMSSDAASATTQI